jgi:hypothetical protein
VANKLTTEEVLADLGRTNINNIKHIKHNFKHLNTINDFTPSDNHQADESLPMASPPEVSSPASQPVGVALASYVAPPWRYLKADLFDNATAQMLAKNKRKLNLKLAMLLPNKPEYQYLAAALNTPWRNVKRGFDFSDPEQLKHFNLMETLYRQRKTQGFDKVQASKCYKPSQKGKGDTVFGISVVIAQDLDSLEYLLSVIIEQEVYDVILTANGLTAAQKASNCVASAHQGEQTKKRTTSRDFFGG